MGRGGASHGVVQLSRSCVAAWDGKRSLSKHAAVRKSKSRLEAKTSLPTTELNFMARRFAFALAVSLRVGLATPCTPNSALNGGGLCCCDLGYWPAAVTALGNATLCTICPQDRFCPGSAASRCNSNHYKCQCGTSPPPGGKCCEQCSTYGNTGAKSYKECLCKINDYRD